MTEKLYAVKRTLTLADGSVTSMLTKFVYHEQRQAEDKVEELHGAFEAVLDCELVTVNGDNGYKKQINMSVKDVLKALGVSGVNHGVSLLQPESRIISPVMSLV